MQQVVLFVLRSPTARRWVVGLVAAIVAAVVAATLTLLGALGGSVSSTMAAAADEDCTPAGGSAVYASTGEARLPVVGQYTYTSPFGMRLHPIYGVYRLHAGMDLVTNGGPIVAPAEGTVQSIVRGDPGAGNFIVLSHGNGLTTRYLHLASISVTNGQAVKPGQQIGVEGSTGGSTGSHLHFEVITNGTPSDPVQWLKSKGVKVAPLGGQGTAPGGGQGKGSGSDATVEQVDAPASSGSGFDLPQPGSERRNSVHTPPMTIPPAHKKAYEAAGRKYGIPWQLLAGIGMEETHHWRIQAVSSAGAMGPMQFTPPTWIDYGVDGDGDGSADILDVEDAIHSAANMLAQNGATTDADGVRASVRRYNNAEWYVNDVLWYAHKYAGGEGVQVAAAGNDCGQVDVSLASNATTDCPPSGSPGEKGLRPAALNGLRCGAEAAPWVSTIYGVGERQGDTDHDDGNAVDFMIPKHSTEAGNARGWKLAKWLQANATKLEITYLIWDGKIWSTARDGEGWRPYTRYGDTPNDTLAHRDHVHASFADVGAA